MKRKTSYIMVAWSAPAQGQPHLYYDEIDAARWSLRCVRGHGDGSMQAFHSGSFRARDLMPEAPIPTLQNINSDPQFVAKRISARTFNKVWEGVYGLNQQSMLEPVLDLLPAFRPKWNAFMQEWANNLHGNGASRLPLYLVLAHLAKFLVDQFEADDTDIFAAVFQIVELWLVKGDTYVHTAASAGLLEDLQNPVHYTRKAPDNFKPWFGPATLTCWERLKVP